MAFQFGIMKTSSLLLSTLFEACASFKKDAWTLHVLHSKSTLPDYTEEQTERKKINQEVKEK